jgi:hypothetical protein
LKNEAVQPGLPDPSRNGSRVAHSPSSRRSLNPGFVLIVAVLLGLCVFITLRTVDVRGDAPPGVKMENMAQPFYPELLQAFRPQLEPLPVTFLVPTPTLPATVGEWSSEKGEMSGPEKQILPPDTGFARRNYWRNRKAGANEPTNPKRPSDPQERIYCTLVLEGRDATSIHRPQVCLEGQGWKLQNLPSRRINIPQSGGDLAVAFLLGAQDFALPDAKTKIRQQMVFAYWFVSKDRVTDSHWLRLITNTKDRLLNNRSHRWAYFLLSSPVEYPADGQSWEPNQQKAINLICEFIADLYPQVCRVPLNN